jgi:hypothetical protein
MEKINAHFLRYNGGWLCIRKIDLDGPHGRIHLSQGDVFMPGVAFMGLDIAKWLNAEIAKEKMIPVI